MSSWYKIAAITVWSVHSKYTKMTENSMVMYWCLKLMEETFKVWQAPCLCVLPSTQEGLLSHHKHTNTMREPQSARLNTIKLTVYQGPRHFRWTLAALGAKANLLRPASFLVFHHPRAGSIEVSDFPQFIVDFWIKVIVSGLLVYYLGRLFLLYVSDSVNYLCLVSSTCSKPTVNYTFFKFYVFPEKSHTTLNTKKSNCLYLYIHLTCRTFLVDLFNQTVPGTKLRNGSKVNQ